MLSIKFYFKLTTKNYSQLLSKLLKFMLKLYKVVFTFVANFFVGMIALARVQDLFSQIFESIKFNPLWSHTLLVEYCKGEGECAILIDVNCLLLFFFFDYSLQIYNAFALL